MPAIDRSLSDCRYTVATYSIYPWVLSDLNMYFLVNWQLVIAVSGPFLLARRGHWFCAAFRAALLIAAVRLRINNDEFCIENDEFCVKMMNFA